MDKTDLEAGNAAWEKQYEARKAAGLADADEVRCAVLTRVAALPKRVGLACGVV